MNRLTSSVLLFLSILIYISAALAKPVDKAYSLETTLLTTEQTAVFYTVQLYASYHLQAATRFAKALTQSKAVAIIAVKQNHQLLYKVIDGRFATYQQAHHYLTNAAKSLRRFQPWVTQIKNNFEVTPIQTPVNKKIHETTITAHNNKNRLVKAINTDQRRQIVSNNSLQQNGRRLNIALAVGRSFYAKAKDQTITTIPAAPGDIYTLTNRADGYTVMLSLNYVLNYVWDNRLKWEVGGTYSYNHLGKLEGTITEFSMPSMKNYSYSYLATQNVMLVTNRLTLMMNKQWHPYLLLGLGLSFNTVKDYNEKPLADAAIVYPRRSLSFADNTKLLPAGLVGIGLNYNISSKFSLGLLYSHLFTGTVRLGESKVRSGVYGPKMNFSNDTILLNLQYNL